jgi:pimeloyl-ACP methyl ester carboxylesterase
MVNKITPNDPRVQYKIANLNEVTYSYILANPRGPPTATVFLIHGWPDLALGWRYQIPLLTSLGLRVVALNMMGYASTKAPESLSFYTIKRAADDVAAFAAQLGLSSIILGGHDYGGAIVYRIAMRYPKLISALFSICTPFSPPEKLYIPSSVRPNFKYQLHLAGPEVEVWVVGEERIRQFLNGMYGGRTPEGKSSFGAEVGVYLDRLPRVDPTILLNAEEMDFYVQQYAINGLRGPLNWYRT